MLERIILGIIMGRAAAATGECRACGECLADTLMRGDNWGRNETIRPVGTDHPLDQKLYSWKDSSSRAGLVLSKSL